MQLLSYLREPAPARAVRRLAQLTPEYKTLFQRLARESGLYIIAGTHPVIEKGELFNAAHLFTPNGLVFRQKKVHLTQTEKGPYQMGRGHGFYVYHTDYGRVAILVCYDVEFPERRVCSPRPAHRLSSSLPARMNDKVSAECVTAHRRAPARTKSIWRWLEQ